MNYVINPPPPQRVGTGSKEISAGKSFASNSFEAFLPKDWQKKAAEGYQVLVELGLRPPLPPGTSFPPPLELYKEWNARNDATVTTGERNDADRQARYREKNRERLAAEARARRSQLPPSDSSGL